MLRHSGLMFIALASGPTGPCLSPGRGHSVVFLGKTLYSHRSASLTQVYKWERTNLVLEGNPEM